MDIISRAEARQKGESKYFTGQPCKNGHVMHRYTQSGTCAGCIREHNVGVEDPTKEVRRAAKAQLVQVKIRAFSVDREAIAASAYALAALRFPVLGLGDIDPRLLPTHSEPAGTALYAFYCHENDVGMLRQVAAAFISSKPTDVAVKAAEAMRRAIAENVVDTTPPENYK